MKKWVDKNEVYFWQFMFWVITHPRMFRNHYLDVCRHFFDEPLNPTLDELIGFGFVSKKRTGFSIEWNCRVIHKFAEFWAKVFHFKGYEPNGFYRLKPRLREVLYNNREFREYVKENGI